MTPEQFRKQILPLKNKLFRFAYSFVANEADAQDVVQDVLLNCWQASQGTVKILNHEAWCMKAVRNRSLDMLKRKGRHYDPLSEHYELNSSSMDPHQLTEKTESRTTLRALIARLPERQREVISLRDLEGYSYKEIAEMMQLEMNHIKVLLHRARTTIKTQLTNVHNYGISQHS